MATNPVTGDEAEIDNIIEYLNDEAHWSFAQIADWLESVGY